MFLLYHFVNVKATKSSFFRPFSQVWRQRHRKSRRPIDHRLFCLPIPRPVGGCHLPFASR
ncbi:hypothetical protein HMPREF0262_01924 [Clostridium sp. ATCC 29733]|nr:hypothetical protein HMPREF0262_01924 [Clostridium sp. ATCC 29733]